VNVSGNSIRGNEVGVRVVGGTGANATGNRVTGVVIGENRLDAGSEAVRASENLAGASGNFVEAIVRPEVSYPSPSATSVTTATATLMAAVNPGGAATSYRFEYGTSASYGSTAGSGTLAATAGTQTVRATLGGLAPLTTYHYRVVAENRAGSTAGADQTLTTRAPRPTVRYAGVAVTGTSARLTAMVDPRGSATTFFIRYGKSEAYGRSTRKRRISAAKRRAISEVITRLHPETVYHYRVIARSRGGVTVGRDAAFRTKRLRAPNRRR
jgi:phosphodiesterase/alkaline phosphatase D-like protein